MIQDYQTRLEWADFQAADQDKKGNLAFAAYYRQASACYQNAFEVQQSLVRLFRESGIQELIEHLKKLYLYYNNLGNIYYQIAEQVKEGSSAIAA
jgi:hypothetical protein